MSVREAAHAIGIGTTTAYRQIREQTFPLPIYMLGRTAKVLRRDVERFANGEPLRAVDPLELVARRPRGPRSAPADLGEEPVRVVPGARARRNTARRRKT